MILDMQKPAQPPDELERVRSLRALGILDTLPEERFDRITRLAQRIFKVPIALITLVDTDRQWFKSCQGLGISETGRAESFCGHTILQEQVFEVPDATQDPRFADNPLVTAPPYIRFYAAYPLTTLTGYKVGTLCIIDSVARRPGLSKDDLELLKDLAQLAQDELNTLSLQQALQERQNIEEQLKQQKEFTANLIQQSAVATVVINRQHQVVFWNKAVEELTGVQASQIIGTANHWRAFYAEPRPTLGDIIIDQNYDVLSSLYTNYTYPSPLASGAIHAQGWFTNLNGKRRYLTFDASPVYSSAGELIAAITTLQDHTAQRLAEEDVQRALVKEKELNELRSRFISMTSHEFRTPLTSILFSAEFLESASEIAEDKKKKHLHRIKYQVMNMTQLLNDILIIGKAEAGKLQFKPAPLNIRKFCLELLEDLELTTLANQRRVIFNLTDNSSELEVTHRPPWLDGNLLRQILSNLLSNALKYSPPNTSVGFTVTYEATELIFEISDQGMGIPAEDQPHIFELFHRATNVGATQGSGLGLAIVKRCLDLHGGTLEMNSQVGEGTTFRVTLQRPLGVDDSEKGTIKI